METVNTGRDSVAPLHPNYQPGDWFGEDQRRAILHILNTSDRITGLRGLAGAGKTTALRELVNACRVAGIEPLFCAPTAAATDVLRKEGFNATTLQSLLVSNRSVSQRNLIVLDEAGAVGIDDMKRLFNIANKCRLVLSGDTGQHASVARGEPPARRITRVTRAAAFFATIAGFLAGYWQLPAILSDARSR